MRARRSDDAARVQDVGEQSTGSAERARQGVGDGPEDEAPRRQLRQIGDHRRDQSRKSSLPVLTKSPTAFSAEVKAPTSAWPMSPPMSRAFAAWSASAAVTARQPVAACSAPSVAAAPASRAAAPAPPAAAAVSSSSSPSASAELAASASAVSASVPAARHRIPQRLPAGERTTGGIRQHARRLAITLGAGAGVLGHARRARGRAARGRCATAPPRRRRPQRRPQPRPRPRTGCRSGRATAGRACRSAPRLRPPPSRAAGRARRSAR